MPPKKTKEVPVEEQTCPIQECKITLSNTFVECPFCKFKACIKCYKYIYSDGNYDLLFSKYTKFQIYTLYKTKYPDINVDNLKIDSICNVCVTSIDGSSRRRQGSPSPDSAAPVPSGSLLSLVTTVV